jgi:hypothetical protein
MTTYIGKSKYLLESKRIYGFYSKIKKVELGKLMGMWRRCATFRKSFIERSCCFFVKFEA